MEGLDSLFSRFGLSIQIDSIRDLTKGCDQNVVVVNDLYVVKTPKIDKRKILQQIEGARLAERCGISFSKVLYHNKDVMIEEYVVGSEMKCLSCESAKKLGMMLAKLHSVCVEDCKLDIDTSNTKTFKAGKLKDIPNMNVFLEQHKPMYDGSEELHFVHQDVSPDNIIIDENGETTLIDYGDCDLCNDVHVDFSFLYATFCHDVALLSLFEAYGEFDLGRVEYHACCRLTWALNEKKPQQLEMVKRLVGTAVSVVKEGDLDQIGDFLANQPSALFLNGNLKHGLCSDHIHGGVWLQIHYETRFVGVIEIANNGSILCCMDIDWLPWSVADKVLEHAQFRPTSAIFGNTTFTKVLAFRLGFKGEDGEDILYELEIPSDVSRFSGGICVGPELWNEWDKLNMAMGEELHVPRNPDVNVRMSQFKQKAGAGLTFGALNKEGHLVATSAVSVCNGKGVVSAVFVDSNERKKGYGRQAMHALIRHAKQTCKTLSLFTDVSGPGKYLYEAIGFQEVGKYYMIT